MTIVYIENEKRKHKLLPLLADHNVKLVRSIVDVISCKRADAVLIDSFGRYALKGILTSIVLWAPLVVRPRGNVVRQKRNAIRASETVSHKLRLAVGLWSMYIAFFFCQAIIYNSQHTKKKLKKFVWSTTYSEVVYNPLTTDSIGSSSELSLPNGSLNIITATNMGFWPKIKPTIIAMCDWLPTSLWNRLGLNWAVLGSGKYFGTLEKEVQSTSHSNRIFIEGWVDNPHIYYDWADIMVHFTTLDAFPNVTMEAMYHSLPIITNANSGGTREQVYHGKNGHVVETQEETVRAIYRYYYYPHLIKYHGTTGRRMVLSRWTPDSQKEVMNRLLEQIEQS
ncbi:glycosyltransferase involved in cell wall biosynthesis [Salinibacter ruber]|uniref:glycosyltransferase n=1 Tax=Salinibacter ruber TaxID=146919 RepID=UPI00216A3278|nr:glycosyltransferase [Salinibacter ruber]MCS3700523.1 glycosyltransferase involved in cell wall biosynthesis [Salinibacter ruber]